MTEFQEAPDDPKKPTDAGPRVPGHPAANPAEGLTPSLFATPPPDLREAVVEVLQTCYDPEIPVNIYDLGLIYGIDVSDEQVVHVSMTLTSPACPVAGTLPGEVQQRVAAIPGVRAAHVQLVWEPPWGKHLLSEAARLQLGLEY